MSKGRGFSRRKFVSLSAGTLAGAAAISPVPTIARGRLEKPTVLGIGAGGKGKTDLEQSRKAGFDVIALADVDDATKLKEVTNKRIRGIVECRESYPDATFGTDYRELLADLGDKIDAVVVSTPDHHHFHASVQAMLAGKHVYCQKPLTHGIWEARMMAEIAAKTGVQTQMGNQAHANDHMRRCVELIRAGVVGKVKEIHTWTNRPIWAQGFATAPKAEKVPAAINWKQWCGPAPSVEYSPLIAPFEWRGWWNYGTGALGDMACHIMDLGYWSMNPGAPKTVVATQNGATDLSPPINSKITWSFGPNQYSAKDGFKIFWYDGYVNGRFDTETWKLDRAGNEYNHPTNEVLDNMDFEKFGSVVIGETGKLFFNRSKNNWVLKSEHNLDGFQWPAESLPRAEDQNNYLEWYNAIQGGVTHGESHFALAGPMTETILLGVLAQRVPGETLQWDAKNLRVKGHPELQQYIQRDYADGWDTKQLLT